MTRAAPFARPRTILLALAVTASALPTAAYAQAAAAAGKFVMAIGAVQVQRGRTVLQVRTGNEVRQGDTIRTAPGSSAQVWLSDGSMVAIREKSEFRIDSYHYKKEEPAGAMGLLTSIVKGGARLLTGAVGKANPAGVKVNTRVALIGIRGTGFDLMDCVDQCEDDGQQAAPGLYGSVFEGQISVTNENGTDSSNSGETFYISSRTAALLRLDRQPTFMADPVSISGGGQSTSEVSPPDIAATVPSMAMDQGPIRVEVNTVAQVPATPPLQADALVVPATTYNLSSKGNSVPVTSSGSTVALISAEYNPTTGDRNVTNFLSHVALGTTGSAITSITYPIVPSFPGYAIQGHTARLMEGGSDQGVVSWGRWADGSLLIGSWSGTASSPQSVTLEAKQGFHWLVGMPTTTAVPNGTYSFSLIGATTPTETRVGTPGGWAVTGGSLVANLTAATVTGSLDLFATQPEGYGYFGMGITASLANGITGQPIPIATAVNKLTGSLNLCTATCAGAGNLLFFGNDPAKPASHAGVTYDFNTGQGFLVQGLAVFGR